MKKKAFVLLLFLLIPWILIIFSAEDEEKVEYNSEGKVIFKPGKYRPTKKSFFQWIGLEDYDGYGLYRMNKVKSSLKNLGTAFWMNLNEEKFLFPENPNDLEIDTYFFYQSYLIGTDKGLPENWVLPNTWKEFNKSNSPFLFVRKPGKKYSGSATVPLFITKEGFQPYP